MTDLAEAETEETGAGDPIQKGDASSFIKRVKSVIADWYEAMTDDGSKQFSARPTLRDFTRSIHRLEDGVGCFEHGENPPTRVPYKNETLKDQGYRNGEIEESHESFGLLAISRVSGGARLFGSHLEQHQHFITLSISRAKVCHGLSSDRYHPTKELISIDLSAAQFAEAITSLNSGVGSPCTIESINHVVMENVPEEAQSEHTKVREGFAKSIEKTTVSLEKARDEFGEVIDSNKTISKGRAKELLAVLTAAAQDLRHNAPFIVDQFRESADKVVTSAKADIESFAQLVLRSAGMEALQRGDLPKLLMGGETKELPEEVPAEKPDPNCHLCKGKGWIDHPHGGGTTMDCSCMG